MAARAEAGGSEDAMARGTSGNEPGIRQPRAAERLPAESDPGTGPLRLWLLAVRCWFSRPVIRALAANPGAPKLLLRCLTIRRWDVQAAVAANPRCPKRVSNWNVWAADWAVSAAVAANPATNPGALAALAGSSDARVRLQLAANPSLPPALADRLLADRDRFVRAAAAANPAAPAAGLQRLADGMTEPAWVLRAVAGNPACPAELSDQLLTWMALGGPGHADPLFDPVSCTGHPGDTRYTELSWYLEQARGRAAVRHPLWRVRAMIMPATGRMAVESAKELARDARSEVRRPIAGARGLPAHVLRELRHDPNPAVAGLAAANWARSRQAIRRSLLIAVLRFGVAGAFPLAVVSSALVGVATTSGQHAGPRSPVSTLAGSGISGSGDWPLWVKGAMPTTLLLDGNGLVVCGLTAAAPHTGFITVTPGNMEVTLDIPGAVTVPGGQAVRQPVVVPAGQQAQYLYPAGSSPVEVQVSGQMVPMPGCDR